MLRASLQVNGRRVEAELTPTMRLSGFLRQSLGLTGLKEGCCEGKCGACTILLDGRPVNACLMLAVQAEGHEIVTIEGLSAGGPTRRGSGFFNRAVYGARRRLQATAFNPAT